jgi:hypothetical protein
MPSGAPFTSHPPAAARAAAGLPFPVHCCWNGMARLAAAPFASGLRFRASLPGTAECRASECSLLCDDLARLGRRRALVDPLVITSYNRETRAALAGRPGTWAAATGINETAWRDAAASAPLDWASPDWAVDYGAVQCFDLDGAKDLVDWAAGPRRAPPPPHVLAVNFTARWLRARWGWGRGARRRGGGRRGGGGDGGG